MTEAQEMICKECGSSFKTTKTGSDNPKCFDCVIKRYPTLLGYTRVWSWDNLVAAHIESGVLIPCRYATAIARHTIHPLKKFGPRVFGNADITIGMCFSESDLKMIDGVPG